MTCTSTVRFGKRVLSSHIIWAPTPHTAFASVGLIVCLCSTGAGHSPALPSLSDLIQEIQSRRSVISFCVILHTGQVVFRVILRISSEIWHVRSSGRPPIRPFEVICSISITLLSRSPAEGSVSAGNFILLIKRSWSCALAVFSWMFVDMSRVLRLDLIQRSEHVLAARWEVGTRPGQREVARRSISTQSWHLQWIVTKTIEQAIFSSNYRSETNTFFRLPLFNEAARMEWIDLNSSIGHLCPVHCTESLSWSMIDQWAVFKASVILWRWNPLR